MSYFVDCACCSRLRGSLLSGITWTQWTVYCLIIMLLIFIPVPTSMPVYTHGVSKTIHVFFLSNTSCGREWSWVFGLKHISLWGQQGLFNWGVEWLMWLGNMHLCVCLCTSFSVHPCKSVLVTVCPCCCKTTSVWASAWTKTLFPSLGFHKKGVGSGEGYCVEGD